MGIKSPEKPGSKSSSTAPSRRRPGNVQSPNEKMNIEKYLIPHVKSEVVEPDSKADVACAVVEAAAIVGSSEASTTVDASVNNSYCQANSNKNNNNNNNNRSSTSYGKNDRGDDSSGGSGGSNNNNKNENSNSNSKTISHCRQKENVAESEANKTGKRVRTLRKKPTSSSSSATPKPKTTITRTSTSSIDVKEKFITDYFQPRRSHRRTKAEVLKSKQMIMEDKIIREDESGFDVVKYEDKGRGVIARVDLKVGDFVLEYAGDLIDLKEARQREELYALDSSVGCYMYYFQLDNCSYCIDATRESTRLGRLINHSIKGANLKTRPVTVGGKARLVFLAKRDISSGEELLYDYGDRSKLSLQSHPWLKK